MPADAMTAFAGKADIDPKDTVRKFRSYFFVIESGI